MKKKKINFKTLFPIIKRLFCAYKIPCIIVLICIILSAISTIASSIFIQQIVSLIETTLKDNPTAVFDDIKDELFKIIMMMVTVYGVGIVASIIFNQTMAVIGQGFLYKIRLEMFDKMESFPVKYFDRHQHGDIMSHYT
ncbi:MAG: hypothetical protein K2G50_03715, partial [Anaeroplasmataceae bacterium]|nr:hypothetical protein [Anaeroplasmataceae bacterium]